MTDRYRKQRRKNRRIESKILVPRKIVSREELERMYPKPAKSVEDAFKQATLHGEAMFKVPDPGEIIKEMKQNRDSLNKDIEKYVKMAEEKLK